MKKRLFIFVEGEDDVRFFGRVIKPLVAPRYDSVEIVPYACIKRAKIDRFLKSIAQMQNDYIFASDIDTERSVKGKKQLLVSWYPDLHPNSIVVVIREIESWYYAGIPGETLKALGLPALPSTDQLTKEDFNALIPASFDSRIDFMFEILKSFSPAEAERHNESFRFFSGRYELGDAAGSPHL